MHCIFDANMWDGLLERLYGYVKMGYLLDRSSSKAVPVNFET